MAEATSEEQAELQVLAEVLEATLEVQEQTEQPILEEAEVVREQVHPLVPMEVLALWLFLTKQTELMEFQILQLAEPKLLQVHIQFIPSRQLIHLPL